MYENDKGQYEISAILSPDQLKFLLEFALLDLLRKGLMIPLVDGESVTLVEFGKEKQELESANEDISYTRQPS